MAKHSLLIVLVLLLVVGVPHSIDFGPQVRRITAMQQIDLEKSGTEPTQPGKGQLAAWFVNFYCGQTLTNRLRRHQAMPKKARNEVEILFSTGYELRHGEIIDFKTETTSLSGISIADSDQSIGPSFGQDGRVRANSMRVVTKSLMKRRALAYRAVNEVAVCRVTQRKQIGLNRAKQVGWSVWELPQDSLTTDYYKAVGSCDGGRRPNDVFKLVSLHDGTCVT
jgi:hypothetical protein